MVSKFVWTISMVLLFYLLTLVIFAGNIMVQSEVSGREILLCLETALIGNEWLTLYLLPLMADAAIAVMQMAFSFLMNSFLSYIVALIYLIVSAYCKHVLLLGNYSMLLRNEIVTENGVGTETGMAVSLVLIGLSCGICICYIRRKDVLGRNPEV